MPSWVIKLTLPETAGDPEETAITQERLAEEVQELCESGFDLNADEYTVQVAAAPAAEAAAGEAAQRTGTEG